MEKAWRAALTLATIVIANAMMAQTAHNTDYIDPKIGSEGLGRVYVGPTMPFGMIRPSAVTQSMPNSGWWMMPEPIRGFAQVHVSGTGGGQKYGNILLMPFCGSLSQQKPLTMTSGEGWNAERTSETIDLGYYSCKLSDGIGVEITAANRAAIYRIAYPDGATPGLAIDAGFFLGYSPIPDQREAQQLVGSQIEVVSDTEIRGYNRVRGGWNNGRAYTVYFYAQADKPFTAAATWQGDEVSDKRQQCDMGKLTGALVNFAKGNSEISLKIGISFISELKAKENMLAEIPSWDFNGVMQASVDAWGKIANKIEVDPSTPDNIKRMLYTGLYHTMLMPSDRTGENPLWNDATPYYDDFYAIWDTYRTSTPLITLLDPKRQADIVNALIAIWKRDGFMPDARSGNANGRTQGGSNADIVIADAFVKGVEGIDYEQALQAMLTDADVLPAGKGEAEGRGGLKEYNTLGYVPFGIDRAGNRTVEYALCDYAIAQVAKGLGKDDLHKRFMQQSGNWRNLWRSDYEHAGSKGFIMPRDANGQWLDSLSYGHSAVHKPVYAYEAMMWEGPWYTPWWGMFFYEAPSWEYSLSVPHDVPGLIEACGGPEAFEQRLDTFFDKGFYNVNNEPSFLSPCLYHWIGKPWRSSERIRQIINANFSDGNKGLPGNDDSGAMSSWLAFHILGLYPNAGHDYYLINAPMVKSWTMHLPNGKDFSVEVKNFDPNRLRISKIELNGKPIDDFRITHSQMLEGGKMVITMDKKESKLTQLRAGDAIKSTPTILNGEGKYLFTFKLHGQTRRYQVDFVQRGDSLSMLWGIERNLQWQSGSMTMTPASLSSGNILCSRMPVDGERLILPSAETAYVLSHKAFGDLTSKGECQLDGDTFVVIDKADGLIHAQGKLEGAEIWVADNKALPIVMQMSGNPLEINWRVTPLR